MSKNGDGGWNPLFDDTVKETFLSFRTREKTKKACSSCGRESIPGVINCPTCGYDGKIPKS